MEVGRWVVGWIVAGQAGGDVQSSQRIKHENESLGEHAQVINALVSSKSLFFLYAKTKFIWLIIYKTTACAAGVVNRFQYVVTGLTAQYCNEGKCRRLLIPMWIVHNLILHSPNSLKPSCTFCPPHQIYYFCILKLQWFSATFKM